eukprot:TRINITY_DN352_c1_g1_i12.p2 TRINITY_DN352_c1_g1~~TRINITY_DN352_c1_g1_i12.p2  ORF type:complete len:114 (-),score=27.46 TRINITY_DN352_c1_g1_i12:503-844(-)
MIIWICEYMHSLPLSLSLPLPLSLSRSVPLSLSPSLSHTPPWQHSNTIEQLGDGPTYFVPPGTRHLLESKGCTKVVELDWWQGYKFSDRIGKCFISHLSLSLSLSLSLCVFRG